VQATAQEAAGEYPGNCGLCGEIGSHRLERCPRKDALLPVLRAELERYVPPGRIRDHHERI